MAEPAVAFLLENLQRVLVDEIDLVSRFKDELKQLEDELEMMKAVLDEFSNQREKGALYSQWERRIREIVYIAEDTVEDCLAQAEDEKSSVLAKLNLKKRNLAKKVKTLREKQVRPVFTEARTNLTSLPFLDASGATPESPNTKDKTIPLLRKDNVVGFDEEVDTLIKTLNEESEKLEVISITGMAGIGKTTLAWKIYCDERIHKEFKILIWVHESHEFKMKEVFLSILEKFPQKDMSTWTEDQLAQEVRSSLGKQKFLLFMDGVSTADACKVIEAAVPKTNKSGKVLITSRYENVARKANPTREPHKLGFLNPEESWKLLQLVVWGNEKDCPDELIVLGKVIAKQCDGVPLAIEVIGGILGEKFSSGNVKEEWEKVSTRVTSHLNEAERTENIILLSYNMLPHDLRDCFLYLAMFPVDSVIPAWNLIRLWIAEGFIKRRPPESLEEVAEENLVDLVARNLVIVVKTNARGGVKTCRLHGMIHEFCKNQSAFAKQDLFHEVKKFDEGGFDPLISVIRSSRRLCIHSYVDDFLCEKPMCPHVRSLLCFSKEAIVLQPDSISCIPVAFRRVRVLDVNPIKFSIFPDKLFQLVHLRYIALSGNEFRTLPDVVSKLRNLQTIKVDTSSRTFEVKADIWKMMQLRHLKTKAAIILNMEGKGKGGENLQTLSRLSAKCCTKDVFNRAQNLKNLGIRGQLSILLDTMCLTNLHRLQKLKLVYDIYPIPNSQNPLRALPSPERFPPNLTTLTLSSTYLDWKNMTTLGKLLSLKVLKLKENAFTGKHWEAFDGGFHHLEVLHIAHMDLEFWTAPKDPFPKLKYLLLKNCERLEEIPSSVLEKSLEVLNIESVTASVVKLAKEMEKKKQQTPNQQRNRRGTGFKLIIGPQDGR